MYRHLTIICLIAGSLALAMPLALRAAAPLQGQENGGSPPPMPGNTGAFDAGQLPPDLLRLNLTSQQQASIGDIIKAQNQALHDSFTSVFNTHQALRDLALSPEYTEAKAKAISLEGAKAMAETAQIHARIDHAIYQLLNPQQQLQWKENIADLEKRLPRPE